MNFTPNELQNLELKRTLYGYSANNVNEVLDKIIEDYANIMKENRELKEKMSVMSESLQNYRSIEDNLTNALVLAQKAAEEVKQNAYDRADNILKDAEIKAQQLVNGAYESIAEVNKEYEDLKNKMKLYRIKCENLMKAQHEIIQQTSDET